MGGARMITAVNCAGKPICAAPCPDPPGFARGARTLWQYQVAEQVGWLRASSEIGELDQRTGSSHSGGQAQRQHQVPGKNPRARTLCRSSKHRVALSRHIKSAQVRAGVVWTIMHEQTDISGCSSACDVICASEQSRIGWRPWW
jgi:hypothetical protein